LALVRSHTFPELSVGFVSMVLKNMYGFFA
jgi:hypothetical protein